MDDRWPDPGDYFAKQPELVRDIRVFARAMRQFDQIADGLDIGRWRTSKTLVAGRRAVDSLLAGYATTVPIRGYYGDARVFGGDMARAAVDAIWVVAAALLVGKQPREGEIAGAVRLVLGGDPGSQAFRSVLTGGYPFVPPGGGDPFPPPGGGDPFPPPGIGDRIPLDKLEQLVCAGGLNSALGELGIAGASAQFTGPYPGMTITGLTPRGGCAGDTIHIDGTGFGATQPADLIVVFGSTRATVVAGSWSATGFDVQVPAGVSECCVSVLRVPQQGGGGASFGTAISDLAGVLTECFGTVGIALGGKLGGLAGRIPDVEEAVCAPDGSNRFIGGPPRITFFRTGAGTASPQRVLPGHGITLTWAITNAASATLSIAPAGTNSPYAVTPTLPSWFIANATSGAVTLPPSAGLVPWKVTVTLTARNRCGASSEAIEIDYSPAPGLVFVGGGMKTSFHVGAIEALAAIPIIPPAVCAGSGLGALSAVCAAADYPTPASLRAFWDASTGHDAWYASNASLFVPGGDFAALNNATWQTENRAEVLTLGALDLQRAFLVPYRPSDPRLLESIIASVAGAGADKSIDLLSDAVKDALKEANQTALSYIPIVQIIYMAAKYAITAFLDSLKQQTANALAAQATVFDDTNLRALLTTALTGITGRLSASGRKVRIPILSLELGRARYGTEGAAISDVPVLANIVTNSGSIVPIVFASSTVPMMGHPVKAGTDNYVDGSVRDPVPIGATVEAGAEMVIVIQPNNRLIAPDDTYDVAGMPRIDSRTAAARDAQFLDGAVETFGRFTDDPTTGAPVGSWRAPVYLVEPSVQLLGLGASFGDLGLVNIMADYGYMRTYDALVPWVLFPDPIDETQEATRDQMIADLSMSTDTIIGLRVAAWELEHALNGLRATPLGATNKIGGGPLVAVPDSGAITDIRARKTDVRDALVARLAITGPYLALARPGQPVAPLAVLPMPRPRAETWYLNWESHSWDPVVNPVIVTPAMPTGDPWVSLTNGNWTVAAATPPAGLPWP